MHVGRRGENAKADLKLGVSMIGLGYHLANWRHPDAPADGNMSLPHFIRVIQAAERGLFDMGFLADGVGIRFHDEPKGALCRTAKNVQFEPLTLLSALAMVTKNIGFVATASTTYNEPYHVARKFASLDHISGGRAGWNVVTSVTDMEARNFNRDAAPGYDVRYDRAAEFVEVVRGLWDSWEDDAFVRDKASGINYDPTKLHVLNHNGPHFKVAGPLNVARTPQGCPCHRSGRRQSNRGANSPPPRRTSSMPPPRPSRPRRPITPRSRAAWPSMAAIPTR